MKEGSVDESGRRERITSREFPIVHRSRRPLSSTDIGWKWRGKRGRTPKQGLSHWYV